MKHTHVDNVGRSCGGVVVVVVVVGVVGVVGMVGIVGIVGIGAGEESLTCMRPAGESS